MKIDTPEKYKAKYDRIGRMKSKKVRKSDRLAGIAAKYGVIQAFARDENRSISFRHLPAQIGHGMKPAHGKRALMSGFKSLMTRPIIPQGWFKTKSS